MSVGAAMEAGFKIAEAFKPSAEEQRQQEIKEAEIKRQKEAEEQIAEFMRGGNNPDQLQSPDQDQQLNTKSANQAQIQDQTGRDNELTVYAAKAEARSQIDAARTQAVDSARQAILERQNGTDFMSALNGGSASIDLTAEAGAATRAAVSGQVTQFAGVDSGAQALAAELQVDAFNRVQGELATVQAQVQAEQAPGPDDTMEEQQEDQRLEVDPAAMEPLEVNPLEQAEALALEVEPEDALPQQTVSPDDVLGTPDIDGNEPQAVAIEVEGPQARPEEERQGPVSADDLLA